MPRQLKPMAKITDIRMIPGMEKVAVKGVFELHDIKKWFVDLEFDLPDFGLPHHEVIIPLEELHTRQFDAYIPKTFTLPRFLRKNMLDILRLLIGDYLGGTVTPRCLIPQGYSLIGNTHWVYALGDEVIGNTHWVYALGDEVIGEVPGVDLVPYNPRGLKEPSVSEEFDMEEEWLRWCKIFCSQGLEKAVLFLCALSPYIRPVAVQAKLANGIAHAYVVGSTGTGKTEFSRLLTQIGGMEPSGGSNLGSDKQAILGRQSSFTDRTFLIDDLNLSTSNRETEKKNARLSEIIQMTSSGGEVMVKGESVNMSRTSLIITGEYLLDSASTINRCVVVKFEEPFNGKRLSYLQENRIAYLRFLYLFSSWICENWQSLSTQIIRGIRKGEFDYCEGRIDPSKYDGYSRIMASHQVLQVCRFLFLEFLIAHEVEEKVVRSLNSVLGEGICKGIKDTLSQVYHEPLKSDVLKIILDIFSFDPDEIVADSPEEYHHYEQKKHPKLLFRHKDQLYYRGKNLTRYLSAKLCREVSSKELSKELENARLLSFYGGEASGRLPTKLSERWDDKSRYYRLNVYAVCDFVERYYPDALACVNSPIKELRIQS